MNAGKLVVAAAALLLFPKWTDACKCFPTPICEHVENADVVLRAVLVSSVDRDRDVSSYSDAILKVVEVFKSEPGVEYAVDEEIQVITPSGYPCGTWQEWDFGEDLLVDLSRNDYDGDDGLYGNRCGVYTTWANLSEDNEDSLRTCTCEGTCGTFQECLPNESGYPVNNGLDEYYCADVCVPTPCGDEEVCELLPVPCAEETFCPPAATCEPATPEPTPAPTPEPEPCVLIRPGFATWWPCGNGESTDSRPCEQAQITFTIHQDVGCTSSNAIMTFDYAGPIAMDSTLAGDDGTEMSGVVSADLTSVTFDIGANSDLVPGFGELGYDWSVTLGVDNCDSGYTWNDDFVQLSYVDDELNVVDQDGFENIVIIDLDEDGGLTWDDGADGTCPTPSPVTDTTPAPTTPEEIISCGSWECGSGYTNVERECSTEPSPYGRRGRRLQSSGDFFTTDGYTTLGNYPICSQESCCETDDGGVSDQCVGISGANWYQCGPAFRETPESCSEALLSFRIQRENSDCIVSNPIVKIDFAGPIVIDGAVHSGTDFISGDVSDDKTSVVFDTASALDLGPAWVPVGDAYLWYFRFYVDNCDTGFTYSDNFFQVSYVDDEENVLDLSGFETPDDIFAPTSGICPDDETPLSLSFEWNDDGESLSFSFEE